MSYLKSESVKVYPSALRGGTDGPTKDTIYDPESRIGTEFNLTNAVNRLTINGSFVIDSEPQNGWLQFSIHGYYFKARLLKQDTSGAWLISDDLPDLADAENVYGSIRLTQLSQSSAGATYQLLSLDSWDGASKILDTEQGFVGVYLSAEAPEVPLGSEIYSLHLLQKVGGVWEIPATSFLRFDSKDVAIGNTPLGDVLSEDNSLIKLNVDNAKFNNLEATNASIDTLSNKTLTGSKGTIKDGVADKATHISDAEGNYRTTDETKPLYLADGVPTQLDGALSNDTTGNAATATQLKNQPIVKTQLNLTTNTKLVGDKNTNLAVTGTLQPGNGGTGKTNLNEVKVGSATNADIASRLGTSTIGGTSSSGGVFTTKTIYLSSGNPVEGLTIFSSNTTPNASLGKTGDIWFKYN